MPSIRKRRRQSRQHGGAGSLVYRRDKKRWMIQGYKRTPKGRIKRPAEYLPREIRTLAQARAEYARRAVIAREVTHGKRRESIRDVKALCAAFAAAVADGANKSPGAKQHLPVARQWANIQGDIRLDQYTPGSLRLFRDALDSDGRKTRTVINKRIDEVRRIIRWGVSMDLVDAALYDAVKTVQHLRDGESRSADGQGRTACTAAQFAALLEHLDPYWQAVALAQRWSGARPSEILNLRPMDIDTSGDIWIARLEKHKTAGKGKSRELAIPKPGQSGLDKFIAGCPPDGFIFDTRRCGRPGRISGGAPTSGAYAAAFKAAGDVLGLSITPYQVRHLRLTEIEAALGRKAASAAGGHADQTITAVYTQDAQNSERRAMMMEAAQVGVE